MFTRKQTMHFFALSRKNKRKKTVINAIFGRKESYFGKYCTDRNGIMQKRAIGGAI